LAIIFFLCPFGWTTGEKSVVQVKSDKEVVKQIERDWSAAATRNDAEAYGRELAEVLVTIASQPIQTIRIPILVVSKFRPTTP
jgi:hypothetical protein